MRFIIDAERDGLYGKLLTVAILIADDRGEELKYFYGGISQHISQVQNEWVLQHVIPNLKDYQDFESETDLLDEVWSWWMHYREQADCFVDVAYPVETHLFQTMVEMNPERTHLAPFPIIDVSSLIFAKGINPTIDRKKLMPDFEGVLHNALDDTRLTNQLLTILLNKDG